MERLLLHTSTHLIHCSYKNIDYNCFNCELNTLPHEGSNTKPETVEQSEIVLYES